MFDTDYQRQRLNTQYGMLVKLNFTEKSWTWEYQPLLIDREQNRIVAGEKPAIFTKVGALEYHLLTDLLYAEFLLTNRASRRYVNSEKYSAYTPQEWYDYDARWMGKENADKLHKGAKRAKRSLWRLARKKLRNYIGAQLPFVK